MSLKNKIYKLQGQSDTKLVEGIVAVMKEMGWSWKELMETPIPTFNEVTKVLQKEGKRQQQLAKRKR